MKKRLVAFCLLSTAFVQSAWAAKIQTYIFDIQKGDLHQQITMTVECWSNSQVVNYHNEFGEHEITVFKAPLRPMQVTYLDPAGVLTSKVMYDYKRSCLKISGLHNARYLLSENTFDNNGSLFYLFSRLYPPAAEPLILNLVQTNLGHIDNVFYRLLICQLVGPVEMYLKYCGAENVEIFGSACRALKYELGIHDSRLAAFWPHPYYFWYQAGTRMPVKYMGLDADQKINTITLVDFYDREVQNQ